MKKSLIALSIAAALSATGAQAATLPAGATLSIDAGSNFLMGGNPGANLFGESGLTVGPGAGNTGTGSHSGPPAAGDVGGVTKPWTYFCNTGYDYMALGSSFGGSTEAGVDMSGWTVTWNGIAAIPMGGDAAQGDSSIAAFTWDGTNGGTYTITHSAHVPLGDPSGFGGVAYDLNLTGTVSTIPVPAAVWLFGSGLLGLVGVARRRKTA